MANTRRTRTHRGRDLRERKHPDLKEAGRRGGQMMRQTERSAERHRERPGEDVGQASRRMGDATQRSAGGATEATRKASQPLRHDAPATGTQRGLMEDTAGQIEEMDRRMAHALEDATEGVSRLMILPLANGSLRSMQDAMMELMDGMARANLRATQNLLRAANPGTVMELQQQCLCDYLDAVLRSGVAALRAARHSADETLRPVEERLEHRHEAAAGARVADVMTPRVTLVHPNDTVQEAARLMSEEDAGAVPVAEGDRLVGMLTDRDIALRVAAEGRNPAETEVREVMTPEVLYAFEDEDLNHIAENMAGQQVRRLPVVDRNKRLVGIISLGDLAREDQESARAGHALAGIRREGGRHNPHAADQPAAGQASR